MYVVPLPYLSRGDGPLAMGSNMLPVIMLVWRPVRPVKCVSLLLGADSVSEEVLSSVSKKERKKQEAIFELLTSERQYVDSLKLVKQVFFDPMAEQQVLTEEEMSKVSVSFAFYLVVKERLGQAFISPCSYACMYVCV